MKIRKELILFYCLFFSYTSYTQESQEILQWKLQHEMQHVVKENNNFKKGIELFEEIYEMEDSFSSGHWRLATVCYDKVGRIDKSLEIMKEMKSRGDSTFCFRDYSQIRVFSNAMQTNSEFCKLCKVYDYAINFPCEHKEYRDSLIKYLILEGQLEKPQEIYVIMGYESYYDSLSTFKPWSILDRLEYARAKIDSLVSKHGYPTIDKVIDPWIEFLAGGSFIHSSNMERPIYYLENYSEEMSPQDFAYISDKIAVKQNSPQVYGTQLIPGKNGHELYPIVGDLKEVNRNRMKKNLEPIEDYLRRFGVRLESLKPKK